MKMTLFSYLKENTILHQLSGFTKLLCFVLVTSAVMLSYDVRFLLGVFVFSVILMRIAKIRFRYIAMMVYYVIFFLVMNIILTYVFAPQYGVSLYGTYHPIGKDIGYYTLTLEQLFYQFTKTVKYMSVIPLGILFFMTTDPSELASSLNKMKVPYKISTTISLTLRYFPDIVKDYQTISLSQQARGVELSKKAKLSERFKKIATILVPLIFTILERVELIANAMDLRGYGKYRTRTWYSYRPLNKKDYVAMLLCFMILMICIGLTTYINHSPFYNPF